MTNHMKTIAFGAFLAGATAFCAAPASAQVDLGVVKVKPDLDVRVDPSVDARVGTRNERRRHYRYQGYASHRWYPAGDYSRDQVYYDRYGGYDCYDAFRYDYENGERVRYESTFCYTERGRAYEASGTRISVRIN